MGDAAEDHTFFDTSDCKPLIDGGLYPVRDWNRADMATLTEQVNDCPVVVSLLKLRQLQTDQLGTPQATTQQESQDGMISFAFRVTSIGGLKKPAPLSTGKPVSEPGSQSLRPLRA
jgi:hypothetical protein